MALAVDQACGDVLGRVASDLKAIFVFAWHFWRNSYMVVIFLINQNTDALILALIVTFNNIWAWLNLICIFRTWRDLSHRNN